VLRHGIGDIVPDRHEAGMESSFLASFNSSTFQPSFISGNIIGASSHEDVLVAQAQVTRCSGQNDTTAIHFLIYFLLSWLLF
jgi:hypothetical protein